MSFCVTTVNQLLALCFVSEKILRFLGMKLNFLNLFLTVYLLDYFIEIDVS